MSTELKDFPLGISGFNFSDLYVPERLKDLHAEFWRYLKQAAPQDAKRFRALHSTEVTSPEESSLLIAIAKHLGDFLAHLFNITGIVGKMRKETQELYPVFRFKKEFLNTRVFKRFSENPIDELTFQTLDERIQRLLMHQTTAHSDSELVFSEMVIFLIDSEHKLKTGTLEAVASQRIQLLCSHIHGTSLLKKTQALLQEIEDWCVHTFIVPSRRKNLTGWISYTRAQKLDFNHLVPVQHSDPHLPEKLESAHHRYRDGFKLTDPRMSQKEYMREVDYCIYCHERDKDSCTKGFREKDGSFKRNPLNIALTGCPLDERISEMQLLRRQGDILGSLAMIMLDNPMCPGTGHRICNDCMKGCIFQKQDPVNIPQNETGILTDVLTLPFGFEIYSLLTRFNPLNRKRPYALPYNGINVIVVGLGPAGYTLTHFLANEGFGVIGIDALKLEPVDTILTGRGKTFPKPIQHFSEMKQELDERVLSGFGGVSEYGITVRWDKNFLAVIYLSLLRRKNVHFYGGVRFGGTLTLDDIWDFGFKHMAIATGAGKPTIIDMKNNLSRGIRKASDFLMALQLTGAFKKSSLANLQVRLPAVVIGGGLTAIDTATELMAYYPVQVEKTLEKFEILSREWGEESVWNLCNEEEKGILREFIEHARIIREERDRAKKERRPVNLIKLCREWGGVSIAYRKRLIDSPAYRLNHEEVVKALEEGISIIEEVTPTEAKKDPFGAVEALQFKRGNGEALFLSARTVCVAAGTSPNTIYEREHPGSFKLDSKKTFFQRFLCEQDSSGRWSLQEPAGPTPGAFFLSHEKDGKFVTFYGDNHPDYSGNVVKAMASAKYGVPHIAKLFAREITAAEKVGADLAPYQNLIERLDGSLVPKVAKVNRLTPSIVEVIVKGTMAARKFEPGQFYRLQNYETSAHTIDGNRLVMEGIALTGAWVDKEKGLLSLIVLEMGGSSRLCATLKVGEPVVVMGPTGTPSEIPENKTVLLVGGGLGNAVLLSISRALKKQGSRIIYFAGYKNPTDIFKQAEIEAATDQVIWACDTAPGIQPRRKQDLPFIGNIVQAMEGYASGKLQSPPLIPFQEVDHLLAIGSDRMMAAVSKARANGLKQYLVRNPNAVASINSPMQCMMKEVCAQCLQRHVDSNTGKESFVFSCFNQDQCMDVVDWQNLNDRLRANSLAEKLTNRHIEYLFQKAKLERI